MKTLGHVVAWTAIAMVAAACSDDESRARLDKAEKRLAKIEKALERIDSMASRVESIDRRLEHIRDLEDRIGRVERARLQAEANPRPATAKRAGPDGDTVYAVPVDGSPSSGRQDAKVTMVVAFEFDCPFCRRVVPTIDQLRKDYGRDLRVVYKHLIVHPRTATIPAQAVCAADRQGRFRQLYDLIWRKGFDAARNLKRDNIEKLAREAGLRMGKFRSDLDGVCAGIVRADQEQLTRVGARGTPAFFINGRFLSGARPIEHFKTLIDEELRKANQRIASGTRPRDYYRRWVLEQGKQSL